MSLPKFSVENPITILMLTAGIILLGIISWMRLPQELFPPITYPQVTVITNYENAAPEEIEALITQPIEESVSAASGIRKVSSTSREGTSIVFCEFNWGTNMDFAALNVREKIDLIKEKLPREAEEPIVMKYNPFETPIMILSVSTSTGYLSPYELRETCRKIIKDELEKIDGVAQVTLSGGREREILVELNQERLRAFNVSILDVIELLKQANLNYPAGTIETSFYEYLVRTIGEFKTVKEMDDVPLLIKERSMEEEQQQQIKNPLTEEERERKKRIIYLRELAKVKDTLKDQSSISRYNGVDNISLSVQKQTGSNIIAVNKQIYEKIKLLKHSLPKELDIKVVYDQGIFIQASINSLRDDALQGGVLTFIILLIFLRKILNALVVCLAIPICILFTFILMYFGKLSLNMMSLGGLALGVGMLVDAGIVVIENIYRHRQVFYKDAKTAAIEATDEVFSAIMGTTLTTVAVFFPMVFVVGIAGQLFKELALTVTYSLMASIFTSMTLIPVFMSFDVKGKSMIKINDEDAALRKSKEGKNKNTPKKPFIFLTAGLIVFITIFVALLSGRILFKLDTEFLPKLDQRQFIIKLNMPAGTNLQATNAVVRRVENAMLEFSVIKDVTVNIGSSKEVKLAGSVEVLGSNQANIVVNLKPRPVREFFKMSKKIENSEFDIPTADYVQQLKDKLNNIDLEGARLEYILQESVFKSVFAGAAPLVIVLKGFDLDNIMIPTTKEIEKQLNSVKGVYGVKDSLVPPSPEIKVFVKKDRASLYQLTVNQVASVAQAAIKGYVATKFKEEGKEIDIRVRLREEDRRDFNRIGKVMIFSQLGMSLFLEQVAYLARGLGPTEIQRESKQRVIFISGNIYKRALNEVIADAKKIIDKVKGQLPQNYSLEIGGENKEMTDSFTSLKVALILSLVLVYMIMASEFESLVQPLIIMFTVPLSLIGVSWTLYLTHTPLSIMVVLGFIMLGGIVVDNGILLVDFINLARKNGLSVYDAAVQSAKVRTRPILMSSLSTIFGLLPLAFVIGEGAELRAPMAKTVMGGLGSATLLTIFVVPSIYVLLEMSKDFIIMLFSAGKSAEEEPVFIKKDKVVIEELEIKGLKVKEKKKEKVKEEKVQEVKVEEVKTEEMKIEEEIAIDKILTQRQVEALDYIRINGKMTRLEYVVKFKIPLPIAEKELEDLVEKKKIISQGEGSQKVYFLRKEE